MTVTAWVGGSLALLGCFGLPFAGAWWIRRWLLPSWAGARARLAEVVMTLAAVLGASQVLGAFGTFSRGPLLVVTATLGVAAALVGHRRSGAVPTQGPSAPAGRGRAESVLAVGAVAIVIGQWGATTARSLREGILAADSLWYHLSRASTFARSGWLTRLHHTAPEFPDAFHPSNAEVVQAVPMLFYGRDAVSPMLNLGWLALVLLAAWCIGEVRGRGALSLVAVAVLLATPLLVLEGAGNAGNDIAAAGLLLAAVALLLQSDGGVAAICIAGVAAGLAMSTKLTVVPAVAVLTVAMPWVVGEADRARRAAAWALPLALCGSYWYVRNWIEVGSPVPSTDLPLLPEAKFAIVDQLGFSVADYLGDGAVWRDWFLPGLRSDFGWAWPALLGAFVATCLLAFRTRQSGVLRAVGMALVVDAAAYVVLPTTALGQAGAPILFAGNVVYVAPALLLALAVGPLLLGEWVRQRATLVLVAAAGVLVVGSTTSDLPTIPDGYSGFGISVVAAGSALGAWLVLRPPGRAVAVVIVVASAVGLAVGGFFVTDRYIEGRYADVPLYRVLDGRDGARVAVAGFAGEFPYHGAQLENSVRYVGRTGPHGGFHDITECDEWRAALRVGGFEHVILVAERFDTDSNHLVWTMSDPAARLRTRVGGGTVFEFDASVADPGCPGSGDRPQPGA